MLLISLNPSGSLIFRERYFGSQLQQSLSDGVLKMMGFMSELAISLNLFQRFQTIGLNYDPDSIEIFRMVEALKNYDYKTIRKILFDLYIVDNGNQSMKIINHILSAFNIVLQTSTNKLLILRINDLMNNIIRIEKLIKEQQENTLDAFAQMELNNSFEKILLKLEDSEETDNYLFNLTGKHEKELVESIDVSSNKNGSVDIIWKGSK